MQRHVSIALVALSWIFSVIVFARLPDRMATHYDLTGNPARWDPKVIGAYLLPVLMLLMWAAARWRPRVIAVEGRDDDLENLRELILTSLLAFLALMHVGILGAALNWNVSLPQLLPLGLGALFLMIGHVLPRLRQSGLIGIRTRFTLRSERVWERTHRVAGAIMTAAGSVMIAAGLVDTGRAMPVVIVAALASALATAGYAYRARG
ncbi:MAG TPA: SdpI family protein [Gemmatimonadaceae bacterium]|nr:SdpI family protein [Gemmatimonadaceae bacterium]